MKGIVFSEFNDMVEATFSPAILDTIITRAGLPSGGAYTTVGTYDHQEVLQLVACLSDETGTPTRDLMMAFGSYLAGRFAEIHPDFFAEAGDVFEFLESIEGHVHVEVRKLYPDAELPTFETRRLPSGKMEMIYLSRRPFADLAEGLIAGCGRFYGDPLAIGRADNRDGDLYRTCFVLTKAA
jgi:hypothetical protein